MDPASWNKPAFKFSKYRTNNIVVYIWHFIFRIINSILQYCQVLIATQFINLDKILKFFKIEKASCKQQEKKKKKKQIDSTHLFLTYFTLYQ